MQAWNKNNAIIKLKQSPKVGNRTGGWQRRKEAQAEERLKLLAKYNSCMFQRIFII
jgi:hypothetical protein